MPPFIRFLLRRILVTVPVLWGVATLVFLVLYITPGDPIQAMMGEKVALVDVDKLRHQFGLDQPIHVRYAKYMWGLLHGDLGQSIITRTSVLKEITSRMPATIELTLFGLIVSVSVGLLVGIIAAVFRGRWADYAATLFSLFFVSVPSFWFCLLLIIAFSVKLDWLPMTGRVEAVLFFRGRTGFFIFDAIRQQDWEALRSILQHLVLPTIAVNAGGAAVIARITRSAMLEVLHHDYVRTARAKGLSERVVIYRHVLRNALIPVITVAGLQTGGLLGGAVITETIFAWPGVGKFTIQAITARDYPLVQGSVLILATGFVLVNLCVDLLYARLDPRIAYD